MIDGATTVLAVVVGDKSYDLNFTLQDSSGVVINLTDAVLTFVAQILPDFAVQFSGAMDVLSAVAGTCKYTVAETDFPVAGVYNCQIEVLFTGSGQKITFDNIQITAGVRVPQ